MKAERRYSPKVDKSTGLVCDQTVMLTGFYSQQGYPAIAAGEVALSAFFYDDKMFSVTPDSYITINPAVRSGPPASAIRG